MNPLAALLASLTGAAPTGTANGSANLSEAGVFAQLLDASVGDAPPLASGSTSPLEAQLASLPLLTGKPAGFAATEAEGRTPLYDGAPEDLLLAEARAADGATADELGGSTREVFTDTDVPSASLDQPTESEFHEGPLAVEGAGEPDATQPSIAVDEAASASRADSGGSPAAPDDLQVTRDPVPSTVPDDPVETKPVADQAGGRPTLPATRSGLERALERVGDGRGLKGLQNAQSRGQLPPGQRPSSQAPASAPPPSEPDLTGLGEPASNRHEGQLASPKGEEHAVRQPRERPTVLPSLDERPATPPTPAAQSRRAATLTSLLSLGAGPATGLANEGGLSSDLQPPGVATAETVTGPPGQRHAAPTTQPLPQPAPVPAQSLAVHIAQQLQNGMKRFEIRLDPPELGRVEVRLDVSRDGHVTTHLTVERPETLDLLQRDARTLERALQDAGLDTSEGGLKFSLKDHEQADEGADAEQESATSGTPSDDADSAARAPDPVAWKKRYAMPGGIDIRI